MEQISLPMHSRLICKIQKDVILWKHLCKHPHWKIWLWQLFINVPRRRRTTPVLSGANSPRLRSSEYNRVISLSFFLLVTNINTNTKTTKSQKTIGQLGCLNALCINPHFLCTQCSISVKFWVILVSTTTTLHAGEFQGQGLQTKQMMYLST